MRKLAHYANDLLTILKSNYVGSTGYIFHSKTCRKVSTCTIDTTVHTMAILRVKQPTFLVKVVRGSSTTSTCVQQFVKVGRPEACHLRSPESANVENETQARLSSKNGSVSSPGVSTLRDIAQRPQTTGFVTSLASRPSGFLVLRKFNYLRRGCELESRRARGSAAYSETRQGVVLRSEVQTSLSIVDIVNTGQADSRI